MKYLGETFDIHTGGIDNLFPHHENEIAQAEGATGKEFVRTWLHCAHLRVNGEKMSKSLGNFFTLRDLFAKGYTGREIRSVLISAHYRQPLNFTFDALEAARVSLARLDECRDALVSFSAAQPAGGAAPDFGGQALADFGAALADDLNTPEAFAALYGLVREANAALAAGKLSPAEAAGILSVFDRMDAVLGLVHFGRKTVQEAPADILELAEQRKQARLQKNWSESDRLRDLIAEKGWAVRDGKDGQTLKPAAP